jgi:hypothetical protein
VVAEDFSGFADCVVDDDERGKYESWPHLREPFGCGMEDILNRLTTLVGQFIVGLAAVPRGQGVIEKPLPLARATGGNPRSLLVSSGRSAIRSPLADAG